MMGSKGNLLRTIGAASGAKSATGMRRFATRFRLETKDYVFSAWAQRFHDLNEPFFCSTGRPRLARSWPSAIDPRTLLAQLENLLRNT
jgi:hypothetical protein